MKIFESKGNFRISPKFLWTKKKRIALDAHFFPSEEKVRIWCNSQGLRKRAFRGRTILPMLVLRQRSVYVRIAGPLLFVKIIWYCELRHSGSYASRYRWRPHVGEPGFLLTWERTILVMNEIGKHLGVGRRVA
jgi:hypothetical protein